MYGVLRAAALLALLTALFATAPAAAQLQAPEIWPVDWFSDLPAVDLSGVWVFDPEHSDPMISEWAGHEVRYEIRQESARIILEFHVGDAELNTQTYRWDGTIQRFDRGGRQVQEAARWSQAGRMLEIAGRHWAPLEPNEKVHYTLSYSARGDLLTFVQENDEAGRTVWRFRRNRGPVAAAVSAAAAFATAASGTAAPGTATSAAAASGPAAPSPTASGRAAPSPTASAAEPSGADGP